MAHTLKKCRHCDNYGLTVMGEAGHTRLYFCSDCGKKTTQYLKKTVKCRHAFEGGIKCTKCGFEKDEEYV
jgi:DNA-directed RNA polymerase subunit RPC12/RpoP